MAYKINFDESIPDMIDRLKQEHVQFKITLDKITNYNDKNNINKAIETIDDMSQPITKHAVEEEARLMRVIMHNAKDESSDSIKIMQEHNWVVDFLKQKIPTIKENIDKQPNEQDIQFQQKAQNEISEFVINLRDHFEEEEQIVFPLALKADLR